MLQPPQHTGILVTTWAVYPAVHNATQCWDPSGLLDKLAASELTGAGLLILSHSITFASAFLGSCALQHCTPPACPLQPQWSLPKMHCSMELWPCLCLYQLSGWPSSQTYLSATSWKPQTSIDSCMLAHLFISITEYQNLKPSLPHLIFKSCPFWNGTAKMSQGSLSVISLPLLSAFSVLFWGWFICMVVWLFGCLT